MLTHGINVTLTRRESAQEIRGCNPAVIVRRIGIVQAIEQVKELCFVVAFETDNDSQHRVGITVAHKRRVLQCGSDVTLDRGSRGRLLRRGGERR